MYDLTDDINVMRILFYVAIATLYFLIMKEKFPEAKYFFPYSIVHISGVIFVYMVGRSVWWKLRYKQSQFVCNGVNGSIDGPYIPVRDPSMEIKGETPFHWAIFDLGSVPPLRGKLATVVIPANQVIQAGRNYLALTLVSRWDLDMLPSVVSHYLRNNEHYFNTEVVYFGKYSQRFIDHSGEEADLNTQISNKDALISSLQKTNQNKFSHYEELKELFDRIGKKGIMQRIADKVKSEEGDS